MTAKENAENWRQYEIRLFLIAEDILAFASKPNMVREVKNLLPNFKQIPWRCFSLLNILICIVRSILLINSKHFH